MAAVAIDLKQAGSFPIRLGESVVKPEHSKRWASVRYNHRPELVNGEQVKGTIQAVKEGKSGLVLNDNGERYGYAGDSLATEGHYVLVLRGKEATLEKLSGEHLFNLTSAPDDSDTAELREKYTQLTVEDDRDAGLIGDKEGEEEPPDPSNPFDYRHFLKAAAVEHKTKPTGAETPRSTAATPVVQARASTNTPLARPAKPTGSSVLVQQKKRKIPPSTISTAANKRAKAGSEAAPSSTAQKPGKASDAKPAVDPPKIRVDRKASLRRFSNDDSGELILENETPTAEKLPSGRSAMSLALSGQLGAGPISLHSATNSPASRIASPAPVRPGHVAEPEEFDLEGPQSPEEEGYRPQSPNFDEGGGDEVDEDADVEDLELPSPATEHKPSVSAATVTAAAAAEEDDLDAQLAAAMAEEEGVVEEEEESEEE